MWLICVEVAVFLVVVALYAFRAGVGLTSGTLDSGCGNASRTADGECARASASHSCLAGSSDK